MKRLLVATITTAMITTSIMGCGKSEPEAVTPPDTTEASTVMSSEEVKEETAVENVVSEQEENKEETTEPKEFVLTEECAVEKLNSMYDALGDLLATNDNRIYAFQYCLEEGYYSIPDIVTKDGIVLDENVSSVDDILDIYYGTIGMYYYNYVNNNSGYYDLIDYVSSHNIDELRVIDENRNTNYEVMTNAYLLTAIFSNDNKLTVDNITDSITVDAKYVNLEGLNSVDVVYQCDIIINDENSGIKAVFDKDGNLLNLNDENVVIDYIPTFPNGLQ